MSSAVDNVRNMFLKLFNNDEMIKNNFKIDENYIDFLDNINIKKLAEDELIETALIFFENDLNISHASSKGFMHRNTLVYRIEKIKKICGLDIRNFMEAVAFYNFIIISKKYSN